MDTIFSSLLKTPTSRTINQKFGILAFCRFPHRIFTSKSSFLTPKLMLKGKSSDTRKSATSSFRPTIFEDKYKVLPAQAVPSHIARPSYAKHPLGNPELQFPHQNVRGEVKTKEEIFHMKKAGKLAAQCLKIALENSHEGVTTDEIDRLVHAFIVSNGAYPSAINFHGFPKSICASPNEVACHGIPNTRPLQNGDLVSYDCTVYLNGFHGDCAGTVEVGNASLAHQELNKAAKESLMRGIAVVREGARVGDIGKAIQDFIHQKGYSVLKEFCGHFIGKDMHMPPLIPHYFKVGESDTLKAGQIFTIEPIICEGLAELSTWDDTWTIVTRDNGACAQWEHTVLVTKTGSEILTYP